MPIAFQNQVFHRVRSNNTFPIYCILPYPQGHPVDPNFVPRLLVHSVFPPIRYFRRRFLLKMQPIHSVLFHSILCRIFLSSLTVPYTSSFFHTTNVSYILHFSLAPHCKTSDNRTTKRKNKIPGKN